MSKPIEYVENNDEKKESLIPDEYNESFKNFLDTLKNLNDSGMLSMINSIAVNYSYIIDQLSEQFDRESTKKLFTNLAGVAALISSINPDKIGSSLDKLGKSINSADLKGQPPGLLNLARMLNNSETSRALALIITVLSGPARQK
ncbi:MAG: hypothetical protein QXZ44_02660 [Ferroplasma sp.]